MSLILECEPPRGQRLARITPNISRRQGKRPILRLDYALREFLRNKNRLLGTRLAADPRYSCASARETRRRSSRTPARSPDLPVARPALRYALGVRDTGLSVSASWRASASLLLSSQPSFQPSWPPFSRPSSRFSSLPVWAWAQAWRASSRLVWLALLP